MKMRFEAPASGAVTESVTLVAVREGMVTVEVPEAGWATMRRPEPLTVVAGRVREKPAAADGLRLSAPPPARVSALVPIAPPAAMTRAPLLMTVTPL